MERKQRNGKHWDWETALLLLNTQTHYPPVGVSCSANTSANWLGTRNRESSYFLCVLPMKKNHPCYQLKDQLVLGSSLTSIKEKHTWL
jgi:hypothetical protein